MMDDDKSFWEAALACAGTGIGAILLMAFVLALHIGGIILTVWVIVKVLQAMGVLA